jgi:regulator of protease activity HflC (stomatin/prohibitin superfamily)
MSDGKMIVIAALCVFLLFGSIGGCMWGYPKYKVYAQEMSGKAVLAEAESSRQVAVREALALKDSAKYKAEAEIIRSEGVAKANSIIGDSLKGHDEYLRYLYIDMMHNTKNQFVYVPTEAGLPIMEASRFAPRTVTVEQP